MKTNTKINTEMIEIWDKAIRKAFETNDYCELRLYTCQAQIIITDTGIFLRSYKTLVAFYDMRTNTIYDMLRYVYGYTSTSTQHIAKFRNWLREHLYRVDSELRYYP